MITGQIYHTCSKSIAGFRIFNNDSEYLRMRELIQYYQIKNPGVSFSRFKERDIQYLKNDSIYDKKLVQIICHSPMPTHLHLTLKQLGDEGISRFMNNILNSYSHYFNLKHHRKGPLWESRFKRVLVETDEQLLHLTRYIHLNPVTAYLVNKPEDWKWSSCREYLGKVDKNQTICDFSDLIDMSIPSYQKFVNDRIAYQRELGKIKDMLID